MAKGRERLKTFVLLPAVFAAVAILSWFTVRTTLQVDNLRQQSVLEATLGLATEKAHRLDRQIIDQDNVVMAIAEPSRLEELTQRWLPTAQRETPSVRAIVVLDETRTVVAFASRASGPFAEEEAFRRTLLVRMLGDMELEGLPPDELRHLHREYAQQSFLLSYWHKPHLGKRYVVVAWHDIGRVVRETMPTLYDRKDTPAGGDPRANRVNVVDEEGRVIYGPTVRSGEFTVGVRFPTTLYNWRVQVSPSASEELASRVEKRRLLEITMVGLSGIVIVFGAIVIVYAAEKERRVSALKSEFVANVSHELKTPLALVRMFAEMLQSGRVASPAKRTEYLDIIVRESERLSALIENVLDFARLERGRGAYEFAEGDVGDAVARAADIYRYRAEREGVKLLVDVAAGLPRARIDERAIQLAVSNLVDNALKYAPAGEEVTVSVQEVDGGVHVAVADRGPGVLAEDRLRIFERFVRLSGTTRDQVGVSPVRGSGIGLALVKHIAESHGGRAWVDSPRADRASASTKGGPGSVFSFEIPARPAPRAEPRREASGAGGSDRSADRADRGAEHGAGEPAGEPPDERLAR